jgi:hypothetical protein
MMWYVSFIAVGLAALRNANEVWVGVLLLLTLSTLCIAFLGVLHRRGKERVWWSGFAVFACAYFLVAFGPFAEMRPNLGTTQLIEYARSEMMYPLGNDESTLEELEINYQQAMRFPQFIPPAALESYRWILIEKKSTMVSGTLPPGIEARRRLRQFTPGVRNEKSFRTVAHCLFCLLAGLMGAFISARMYREQT